MLDLWGIGGYWWGFVVLMGGFRSGIGESKRRVVV
jgi:hypothetical protein